MPSNCDNDLDLDYGVTLRLHRNTIRHLRAAREFRRRYIDPLAQELDRRMLMTPEYHAEDVISAGCAYHLLSLPLPRFVGGQGDSTVDTAEVLEELCAGCAGIANILGAHYLGLSGSLIPLDLNIYECLLREVAQGEKDGRPIRFAAAVTEPMAGTVVETSTLPPHSRLASNA